MNKPIAEDYTQYSPEGPLMAYDRDETDAYIDELITTSNSLRESLRACLSLVRGNAASDSWVGRCIREAEGALRAAEESIGDGR